MSMPGTRKRAEYNRSRKIQTGRQHGRGEMYKGSSKVVYGWAVEREKGLLDLDNLHPSTGMPVPILPALLTQLDRVDPFILERLVDTPSRFGIRVEHVLDDISAFARNEIVQRRRGTGGRCGRTGLLLRGGLTVFCRVLLEVGCKRLVGRFGHSPWQLLELHAIEHDGRRPNIDKTSVVL